MSINVIVINCRNCGGAGFSVEGGDCPACQGTGKIDSKSLPPQDICWLVLDPSVSGLPADFDNVAEAEAYALERIEKTNGQLVQVVKAIRLEGGDTPRFRRV